ncbi:5882_t:CDS:2 [Cetraspora pellucida]|uniref:5882_t:CDS:1 n=1 Tax=Cetraspora pellucida TaxID=1433469 RepID=A0ACA9NKT3_9GLOM|nr:5882_t:CDS:2 [Cetraspora pellucida]
MEISLRKLTESNRSHVDKRRLNGNEVPSKLGKDPWRGLILVTSPELVLSLMKKKHKK